MASVSFGGKKRPVGKQWRSKTARLLLDNVYGNVDSAFTSIEQTTGAGYSPVRAATTGNVSNLNSFSVSCDGVTLVAGDRVLLWKQTTKSQNGIYVVGTVSGGAAPLTRSTDLPAGAVTVDGDGVWCKEGTLNGNIEFRIITAAGSVGTVDNDLEFMGMFPLGAGKVTATELASDAVTTAKILAKNVTTAKIDDLAVTSGQIGAKAVTTAKIDDLAVTSGQIGAKAVTTAKIDDKAVTASQIDDATITASQIANGTITGTQLAAGSVTPVKIGTISPVSVGNVGSGGTTLSASQLLSGVVTVNATASMTVTFDTAANIIAALTGSSTGTYFDVVFMNLNLPTAANATITFSAGSGNTLYGGTQAVSTGGIAKANIFRFVRTGASTMDVYKVT